MNIAITGHSKGLGYSVFKHFKEQGHTVIGFSRSNGYDISKDQDKILEKIQGFDLFFNNATNKDKSQTELLLKSYGIVDKIIVSGSFSTNFKDLFLDDDYVKNKIILEEACKFLNIDKDIKSQILYLDLCDLSHTTMNTNNPRDFLSDYTIDHQEVINAIEFWLNNSKVTKIQFSAKLTEFLESELKRSWHESKEYIDGINYMIHEYKQKNES